MFTVTTKGDSFFKVIESFIKSALKPICEGWAKKNLSIGSYLPSQKLPGEDWPPLDWYILYAWALSEFFSNTEVLGSQSREQPTWFEYEAPSSYICVKLILAMFGYTWDWGFDSGIQDHVIPVEIHKSC